MKGLHGGASSRIRNSRLHLVTDRSLCPNNLVEAIAASVHGGVDVVHLREGDLTARELLAMALQVREVIGSRAALIVNDRLDVALATGAEGVQLGAGSLPVSVARQVVGRRMAIGVSVHGLEEAVQAEKNGADYLILGTIYPSRSHPGYTASGTALVREVVAEVSVPVFAIGGVNAANVSEVIAAGSQGAAVISAILADPDPEAAARRLRQLIGSGMPRKFG
ncbi:MAG: thiamine phosphate synthase [Deltaproteobacteria bacterium]|nr:thiamine phosphate synthase [Deltaproteobacteria bacterium]